MNKLNKKTMDLKELYKKEKGLDVDVEVGGLSVLYYSEKYVEWLEAKINYTRSCELLNFIDKQPLESEETINKEQGCTFKDL